MAKPFKPLPDSRHGMEAPPVRVSASYISATIVRHFEIKGNQIRRTNLLYSFLADFQRASISSQSHTKTV